MTQTDDFGVPGVSISPGHHVCALFDSDAARDEVMLPYFATGLRAGERCVMVLDTDDPSPMLSDMGSETELAHWRASGLLHVKAAPNGDDRPASMTTDDMLGIWDEAVDGTRDRNARAGGEAAWWLRLVSEEGLIRYEAELTRHIPERLGVLCMYDLRRFGGRVLIDAVRTHPLLLIGGRVIHNPYYVPPREFLAERDAADADHPPPTEEDVRDLLAAGREPPGDGRGAEAGGGP